MLKSEPARRKSAECFKIYASAPIPWWRPQGGGGWLSWPSSLRPLSVLELALPRRLKRVVHRAFGSDAIVTDFDRAGRAAYQEAAGRPLHEPVRRS